MDEREWLACADPMPMLHFLQSIGRASERKLRLFAIACCRHLFRKVRVPLRYEQEVDVGERYADGAASSVELWEARLYSNSVAEAACMNTTEAEGGVVMADCAALNAAWAATQPGPIMPDDNGLSAARLAAEQAIQCDLLRDVFGPRLLVPAPPDPAVLAWQGSTVVHMAGAIYESRRWEDLPVLGDALEDAGVNDRAVLDHCRGPGPHVRGCHVLDLLLGKK